MAQHPEGLSFEPEGLGWTTFEEPPDSFSKVTFLTDRNVESVRTHHPLEWGLASDALDELLPPAARDRRTGAMTRLLTDQERERLTALAVLIEHGAVTNDREPAPKDASA